MRLRSLAGNLRRIKGVALIALGLVLGTTISAPASHQFTDVPNGSIAHNAVDWLVNRAITLGCAAGLFCPSANVTRDHMALFMNRLGDALNPRFLNTEAGPGAIDIDTNPFICQTADFTPTYPQVAKIDGWTSLQ